MSTAEIMVGIEIKATYKGLESEPQDKGLPRQHYAWSIEIKRAGKVYAGPYTAGLAHRTIDRKGNETPTPPTLASYLYCLQSDAQCGEHLLFEDFADDLGFDRDSRKAEAIWRACQKTRGELMKFFGQDFETFMSTNFDELESEAAS